MISKNVYKEARMISEIIGIFALIGIVGGVIYALVHIESNAGYIVAFCSVFLLLVVYICTMVSHIGENMASLTKAEDANPTAKESFERLLRDVKHPDKTDKS
jgi:xanthosine utilization system XapX-like protein